MAYRTFFGVFHKIGGCLAVNFQAPKERAEPRLRRPLLSGQSEQGLFGLPQMSLLA